MEIKVNVPDLPYRSVIIKFLRSGKILIVPQDSGFHFTVHPGIMSGSIDVHRTDEHIPQDNNARYETLITIPRADIVEKIRRLGTGHVRKLLTLLRPIRIGWMAHRHLGVMALLTEDALNKVCTIRLTMEAADEVPQSWMCIPDFLEEIFDLPNETFLLFDSRRQPSPLYGVLFKLRDLQGEVALRWIRFRDLTRWNAEMKTLCGNAFREDPLAASSALAGLIA